MSKLFYPKLATINIKNNTRTYMPYILTSIGIIAMFYNMCYLAVARDIGDNIKDSMSLRIMLRLGSIVIGIFSVIFLFYINSFLIKRRKKEFGLFNILGMEKKHVARIMFFETLFSALISITAGILTGILLSKLMILLLLKIIAVDVGFGFEVPLSAIISTLLLFGGIFALNLIYNICQVHLAKPVELLKGGNVGEKVPKTRWLMAILGTICLGIGYYIALTTETPLAALNLFFIAVVLVIIGTYLMFIAGSIAILKMLRKNKKYYYKPNHFISVSGMIYRMKQNAAGLASICILSTMVIVMLSTTISLYVGIEDVLRTRYPRNIIIDADNITDEKVQKLDQAVEEQLSRFGAEKKDIVRYRSMSFAAIQDGAVFSVRSQDSYAYDNISIVVFITADEYNKIANKDISLSEGEALLCSYRGNIPGDSVRFGNFELSIKERLSSDDTKDITKGMLSAMAANSYFFIVKDVDAIKQVYKGFHGENTDVPELSYYYAFDVSGSRDVQINLVGEIRKAMKEIGAEGYVEGPEAEREGFYSLYGGLFYLGLFLGILFIMATVLIIYYKQVSEGYDDKERFGIMQKVGMSREEVWKAIRSQVLSVFFLPLLAAVIHIAFAFKVITKLLYIFNLTNIPLFALCTVITILVFAVFYTIVYAMTAKTYYKIVS